MGMLGGLGEATYRSARQFFTHRPAALYYWELTWMAPLSAALGGAFVGLCLAAGAAILRSRVSARAATVLFGFIVLYPVMQLEGIPLHWSAEVLLSLGIAFFAADLLSAHMTGLEARILRARPYVAAVLCALALVGVADRALSNERLALLGREDARPGLPNVLLIILDTVRAADLSLYGYGRPTTPWLSEWASNGVVFDEAYSTAPWTLPSHASLFTGHYASDLSVGFNSPLDSTYPTLAEVLGRNGYVTAGFAANVSYTSRMSGLQRGFDRYEAIRIDHNQFVQSSWLSLGLVRHIPYLHRLFHFGRRSAEDITTTFLDWERHKGSRPFFAFLNLLDAHAPYEPPERYRTFFGPPPERNWDYVFNTWGLYPDTVYGPDRLARWHDRYDGAIRYIDDRLRAMFDTLQARGVLDSTLVVVTADHGEMWGENGQIDHATSLYVPLLHVPLVISYPGRVRQGQRVTADVSLRDVAATIVDLTGLESSLPGYTLRPLWDHDGAKPAIRSPRRSDLGLYPEEVMSWAPGVVNWAPAMRGPMFSLVDDSLHYIVNGDGVEELYDLKKDPFEAVDLAGNPETAAALRHVRAQRDSLR